MSCQRFIMGLFEDVEFLVMGDYDTVLSSSMGVMPIVEFDKSGV
jgi:hypothetical protein